MFLTENMSTLLTDKRLAYYVALLTDYASRVKGKYTSLEINIISAHLTIY